MNSSKTAIVISTIWSKFLNFVGYSLGFLTLILIVFCFTDLQTEGTITALIFFLFLEAVCIFAVVKGTQIKKRIKRFKLYVGLISIEHQTYIEQIANSTSQSVDFVTKDIQSMIDKKYFSSAHINKSTNQIIVGNLEMGIMQDAVGHPLKVENQEMVNIKCSGCGAINSVKEGIQGSCEYCGLALS